MSEAQAHRFWLEAERAREQRNPIAAEAGYRKALAQVPGHVPSLLGLAGVQTSLGAQRASLQATLQAAAAKPSHPALLFGLAQRLRHHNEYARVVECLRHPALKAGVPSQVLAQIAMMELSLGLGDDAMATIALALRREATHAASLYVRGNLHAFHGRVDAATDDYEACLRSDPRMFQASWMRSGLRTQTADAHHVDRLRRQLAAAAPATAGETYLRFALHKELHDLGEHAEAWKELMAGCAIKHAQVGWRAGDHSALVRTLVSTCDAAFVSRGNGGEAAPEATPIFVVGMYRSGTTLVERMISGHPDVHAAGETYAFAEQVRRATDHAIMDIADAEMARRAVAADFGAVARGYAASATWLARGKAFFTEKLPVNGLHMAYIARALPTAKIVYVTRDPVDTCFSNLRTLFSGAAGYSYRLDDLAAYAKDQARLMAHWREVMPDRFIEVDYRELVASPEPQARRIAAWCGLDYDAGMIDVGRKEGMVSTASALQVRDGIRTDRHAAWAPYTAQMRPLLDALAQP